MADLDKIELDLNNDGNFDEYNLRDARIDKEDFEVFYAVPRGAGYVTESRTGFVEGYISNLYSEIYGNVAREIPYSVWETMTEQQRINAGHVMITDAPDGLTVAEVNEKVENLTPKGQFSDTSIVANNAFYGAYRCNIPCVNAKNLNISINKIELLDGNSMTDITNSYVSNTFTKNKDSFSIGVTDSSCAGKFVLVTYTIS